MSHQKNLSKEDHSGKKFGKLLLFEKVIKLYRGLQRTHYKCKCECGKEKIVSWDNLHTGGVKSCGCLIGVFNKARKIPSEKVSFNKLFGSYQQGAKARGFNFELSVEDFKNLTKQDCYYCGCPPTNILCLRKGESGYTYNGIDRIDSKKGYLKNNCVSCCTKCNRMKLDYNVLDFLEQIKKIHSHSIEKNRYVSEM